MSGGYDNIPVHTDFYSGNPVEQPLNQDRHSHSGGVRKTGRHQAVQGRRKETVDPREKQALLALFKAGIMLLLLMIAFFMLWKGIKIYEESVFQKEQALPEKSPVLREFLQLDDFDIRNQDARDAFADRIDMWKEADRLVRSAEAHLLRSNYDQAIVRCQDALKIDPAHMGALEHLGALYFQKGMYVEAINSYIRLLSVDPSRRNFQEKLIQSLDAHGDANAVVFMSNWYLEQNPYDENVQRYLANALYQQEKYDESAEAYERVLKDSPNDVLAMEQLANTYVLLKEYGKSLVVLEKLRERDYTNQRYYRMITMCNAQLGNSQETVQTLGKAAHLFGQGVVVGWMQDPMLDPVREDRTFQSFADRVGGEEFRKWLEQVARAMDSEGKKDVAPQLIVPTEERIDPTLLQRDKPQ